MFMDISDSNSSDNWQVFFVSLVLIEALMICLFRAFPNFWGSTINEYYNKFNLNAIMIDLLIVLIGFWITQYVYNLLIKPHLGWNVFAFIALFAIIQMTHDLLFYFLVIQTVPAGNNTIIDLMKTYGKRHGFGTVLGDTFMVILATLLASSGLLNNIPLSHILIALFIGLYVIGFILNTHK